MRLPFIKLKTLKSQFTKATNLAPPKAGPDELLGELFQDVQLKRIYPDGITFVDTIPKDTLRKILKKYDEQRLTPGFDLAQFVNDHFGYFNPSSDKGYHSNPDHTVEEHIDELWDVMTHEHYRDKGSILALPHPYIVPGGRFGSQYYWDSYFVMIGLAASDRYDLIDNMMKNYAFMIRKLGFIPTANRTYYVSRSHPPFFSQMVKLLGKKKGKRALLQYLPYLVAEHHFWMKGHKDLSDDSPAKRRVVLMPDGSILNRYYDNKHSPRPESYKEDIETSQLVNDRVSSQIYTDLRAAAESGWDFSSRWFKDGRNLETIHTTEIIPVDLNCLLYQLEMTIAEGYDILMQSLLANRYRKKAEKRADAIRKYCYAEEKGFYFDYDFVAGKVTGEYTLAGVYPMYAGFASKDEAELIAKIFEKYFMHEGGLLTTLKDTGQQWDAPNGWAPLQWVAIQGLRKYDHRDLAEKIKKRWIEAVMAVYNTNLKLVEKYNVLDIHGAAGGGEYQLQDGFGWTNGVLMALLKEDKKSGK